MKHNDINSSNIKLDENSIFSVDATDYRGEKTGKLISSYDFMTTGGRILIDKKDSPNFADFLYEYSVIIKLLAKNEVINEMTNRIENMRSLINY